jgi:hypothetical protein
MVLMTCAACKPIAQQQLKYLNCPACADVRAALRALLLALQCGIGKHVMHALNSMLCASVEAGLNSLSAVGCAGMMTTD